MEDMNEKEGNAGRYILIAVLAFLVGFGSAWLYFKNKNATAPNSKKPSSSTSTFSANIEGSVESNNGGDNQLSSVGNMATQNSIFVSDQKPGTLVNVKSVNLVKSGWVVIREDNGAGQPGKILGAQLFDPGPQSGSVELLRGMVEGAVYYAMPYNDNGDRAFDPKSDTPIVDDNGMLLKTMFKATAAASSEITPSGTM